jgi:group I intron endonuclease
VPAAFVYIIQNVKDGKVYVGKTTQPNIRFSNHLTYARNGSSKGYLYRAIRRHGEPSFTYSLIEEYQTETEALEAEIFLIAYLRSIGAKLYNATEGGEGFSGHKLSPEKIKERVASFIPSMKKAWRKPEVRLRFSQARKKMWLSEEFRIKHKEATIAGWADPLIRKVASDNAIRTWTNQSSREKLMEANARLKSRQAKGAAASKRWKDPEHRKKAMDSAMNPVVLEAKRQASLRRWARYRRDHGLTPKPGDSKLLD